MRKLFFAIFFLLCIIPFPIETLALGKPSLSLFIDGVALETDVPPTIKNPRVFLPFRSAAQALLGISAVSETQKA